MKKMSLHLNTVLRTSAVCVIPPLDWLLKVSGIYKQHTCAHACTDTLSWWHVSHDDSGEKRSHIKKNKRWKPWNHNSLRWPRTAAASTSSSQSHRLARWKLLLHFCDNVPYFVACDKSASSFTSFWSSQTLNMSWRPRQATAWNSRFLCQRCPGSPPRSSLRMLIWAPMHLTEWSPRLPLKAPEVEL